MECLDPHGSDKIQRPCDDGTAARGGTATTKGYRMTTYAMGFLRGHLQELSTRLMAGKISDRDRQELQELVDFFTEHPITNDKGETGFPCQVQGCDDLGTEFQEFNDDDGAMICFYHHFGVRQGDFNDARIAAPGEALHAKEMTLFDVSEGDTTDYGTVLGFYTGQGFTHWVATLDYPTWDDIYQDGNNFFGPNTDRFGRVRFWRLMGDARWELVRWAHLADMLPMGETDRGTWEDRYGAHPLDTPIGPPPGAGEATYQVAMDPISPEFDPKSWGTGYTKEGN